VYELFIDVSVNVIVLFVPRCANVIVAFLFTNLFSSATSLTFAYNGNASPSCDLIVMFILTSLGVLNGSVVI